MITTDSMSIATTTLPLPLTPSTMEPERTIPSTGAATSPRALTPPSPSPLPTTRARSVWRSGLDSALRTALAFAIIGLTTYRAPAALRRHVTFPAFSYVCATLVVGEATLGDGLRGAASAFYGTALGVLPAMLTLLLLLPLGGTSGDGGFSSAATTSLIVSVSAFVVALPKSSSLVAKRIALGQIVIIYAANFNADDSSRVMAIMHPVHVAASTALGVVASLIAVLFPHPRLACHEVNEKKGDYIDMATERLRLLINGLCADNTARLIGFVSQAKCLASASTKLLQTIKLKQGDIQWEKPPFKLFASSHSIREPLEMLQEVESTLQGMDMALADCTAAVPAGKFLGQQWQRHIISLRNHITLGLVQCAGSCRGYSAPVDGAVDELLHPFPSVPQSPKDLPPLFFLFCLRLLHTSATAAGAPDVVDSRKEKKIMPTTENAENSCKRGRGPSEPKTIKPRRWPVDLTRERFVVALKCSLSLGLAVLFGILYSKDNGYWSGLTVAITMSPWREATFKLANLRAQGTALGSVYGVLGSLISQNLMELRFLVLLPWIIFTSLLRQSRMYGPAGSIAAVISAIIILGRRNYGSPTMFAITRLTETFIGFSCAVLVEVFLQPARASTMAREQLSLSLKKLAECAASSSSLPSKVLEMKRELRQQLITLKKRIGETEAEPNFWFAHVPVASYNKLHSSMSKVVELLAFLAKAMELLEAQSLLVGSDECADDAQAVISGDVEQFRELLCSTVKCLEEAIRVKSLAKLEEQWEGKRSMSIRDIESGKGQQDLCAVNDEEEVRCEKIVVSLLQHANEVVERLLDVDVDVGVDLRSQVVLCLAAIGFCMRGVMRETREMEKGILELVQSENPGRHINLQEISCKVRELTT